MKEKSVRRSRSKQRKCARRKMQEAFGPSFFSPFPRLLCRDWLSLLALAQVGRFSSLNLVRSMVQGLLIRSPESLRPLTSCNCDCDVLTARHVFGFAKIL